MSSYIQHSSGLGQLQGKMWDCPLMRWYMGSPTPEQGYRSPYYGNQRSIFEKRHTGHILHPVIPQVDRPCLTVHHFQPGDLVLIETWKEDKPQPSWEGPYPVLLTIKRPYEQLKRGGLITLKSRDW